MLMAMESDASLLASPHDPKATPGTMTFPTATRMGYSHLSLSFVCDCLPWSKSSCRICGSAECHALPHIHCTTRQWRGRHSERNRGRQVVRCCVAQGITT